MAIISIEIYEHEEINDINPLGILLENFNCNTTKSERDIEEWIKSNNDMFVMTDDDKMQ